MSLIRQFIQQDGIDPTRLNTVDANGSSHTVLYDPSGNPIFNSAANRGYVQLTDGTDLHAINSDGSTNNRIVASNGTVWELEKNGAMPVNIQDQTSPPIDDYFLQSISNFTIASDTTVATPTTVPNTFTATAGHGIVATDEILLLDTAQNRSFFATVLNVAVNVITVDRPLDESYAAATTLGRIVTCEMAVDGSVTPQIFSARAGTTELDITRIIITIISSTSMDDSRFGGITALTNGFAFRILNSFKKTIFNFHSNNDIKQFCFDVNYSDKAPAGFYGLTARITFGGQDKHGVVLRIGSDDYLQWIVQDDLTGLDSVKVSLQGHEVTD
jgi:hypothetical protein